MSDPDEENKSCHSSSSDTLTCSIPEVTPGLTPPWRRGASLFTPSPVSSDPDSAIVRLSAVTRSCVNRAALRDADSVRI